MIKVPLKITALLPYLLQDTVTLCLQLPKERLFYQVSQHGLQNGRHDIIKMYLTSVYVFFITLRQCYLLKLNI